MDESKAWQSPANSIAPFHFARDQTMKHALRFIAAAAALAAANAHAVTDASGDFLASFTGAHAGALDILSAEVSFDVTSNNFLLHAHTAGTIGDAGTAAYVFGFNRGGVANSPFGAIGEPGVSFNATATLRANGTGAVGATAVPTTVAGDDIFGTVSASLLPPNGFDARNFTWALWSIDTSVAGLPRNADFAPDANLRVAVVPEPETYALMLAGLGFMGWVARRRATRHD